MDIGLLEKLDEIAKSQKVRAFDVYALGPFLVWASFQKTLGRWPKRILFVSGVMTVLYNWENYRNIEAGLRERVNEGALF